jgi:hypothetical protein
VRVAANGPTSRDAVTGPAGFVTLQALPTGTYDVSASLGGFDAVDAVVVVTGGRGDAKLVDLQLHPATPSELRATAGSTVSSQRIAAVDPNVAAQLLQSAGVAVLPASSATGAALSLEGTAPNESRFTLDGVPLPAGAGAGALRAVNALVLDRVEIAPGPFTGGNVTRNAIGGVVNYRTTPLEPSPTTQFAGAATSGYQSGFGAFQVLNAQVSGTAYGASLSAVTGSGDNRAQLVKAAYAVSPATSLALMAYGSQSDATANLPSSNAPAYAVDLSSQIEGGTFSARSYGSSATNVTLPGSVSEPLAFDRIRGFSFGYALPAGTTTLSFAYDRSHELATATNGASVDQGYSSVALRADLPLTARLRVNAADVLSSGTGMTRRNDPQLGVAYRASERLTLHASAGTAFSTAPLSVALAAGRAASTLAPETSRGVQAGASERLNGNDSLGIDSFALAIDNRFANLSQARSSGVVVSFKHVAARAGLSAGGYVGLTQSYAYGTPQAIARYATLLPNGYGAQTTGVPYGNGRLQLGYRRPSGLEVDVGSTYYGRNSAYGTAASAPLDATLHVPIAGPIAAQFGVRNVFGRPPPASVAETYGYPNEVTFSLGGGVGAR